MRDFQRKKVYDAGHKLWINRPFRKDLRNVDGIKDFLKPLYVSELWKEYDFKIDVKSGQGRRNACGYYDTLNNQGVIKLPRWSRNEIVILHEVAHVLTQYVYKSLVAPHGIEFCQIYLNLIEIIMGINSKQNMIKLFKEYKVKF